MNNKIVKNLKEHCWSFDRDKKELTISRFYIDEEAGEGGEEKVTLDKIRLFSLFRFLIRISQKMSARQRRKREK